MPCCEEKVELLIQSEAQVFAEEDREWLSALDEPRVDRLLEVVEKVEDALQANAAAGPPEPPSVDEETLLNTMKERMKDPQVFMEMLPEETREQMQMGLRLFKQHKSHLVETIMANAEGVFEKEELEGKPLDELEKISRLIQVNASQPEQPSSPLYTPMGSGNVNIPLTQGMAEEALLPPGVEANDNE